MTLKDQLLDLYFSFKMSKQHKSPNHCLYIKNGTSNPMILQNKNLPVKGNNSLRLVIISDTHERHQGLGHLPHGDVLIHCGDILMVNRKYSSESSHKKVAEFNSWLGNLNQFDKKIVIAGNHDNYLQVLGYDKAQSLFSHAKYVENESFTVKDVTFFATPLSNGRSNNKAFQNDHFRKLTYVTAKELLSPIDILITHGDDDELRSLLNPKFHIYGHAHNAYGVGRKETAENAYTFTICAAIMDKDYSLRNLPIILDISLLSDGDTNLEDDKLVTNAINADAFQSISPSSITSFRSLIPKFMEAKIAPEDV